MKILKIAIRSLIITIFAITFVYAGKVTIQNSEGSLTMKIPGASKGGTVQSREIIKIIKKKLEQMEYDHINHLGRYERRAAMKKIKAMRVLLASLPGNSPVKLKKSTKEEKTSDQPSIENEKPIDKEDFKDLVASIKNKSFTSDKVIAIKTAAKFNYFKLGHLKRLLKMFKRIDARNRLKIIEAVYPKVINKKQGYTLIDYFSYKSDKRKVRELINKYR
ncbi:MAG: DUF4476 domain-containing protein [bacterium]|nr:DUF4476 domain-containing protein [bacterium]